MDLLDLCSGSFGDSASLDPSQQSSQQQQKQRSNSSQRASSSGASLRRQVAPPILDDEPARDGIDEDELVGLCSGTFANSSDNVDVEKDRVRRGNLLDDIGEDSQSQEAPADSQSQLLNGDEANEDQVDSSKKEEGKLDDVAPKPQVETITEAVKEEEEGRARRIVSSDDDDAGDDDDDDAKRESLKNKKKKLKKRRKKINGVESDGEEEKEEVEGGGESGEDGETGGGDDEEDEENDELAMFMKLSQKNQISKKQKVDWGLCLC